MRSQLLSSTLIILALHAPGRLAGQGYAIETSVTFLVPVHLTQLSPDLERVRALCAVLPSAVLTPVLPAGSPLPVFMAEAPVVSGQVNTTLRSEYLVYTGSLQNAIGKQANYACQLQGYSKSLQRWDGFADNATDQVFRLTPTPPVLDGTFIW